MSLCFVGHIIGYGERSPDPDKVSTVKDMKIPETKRQVRRLIGFFSYFRDYYPQFCRHCKTINWPLRKEGVKQNSLGTKENQVFQTLKEKLCEVTTQPMSIADFNKLWIIQVDASSVTVVAALLQDDGSQGQTYSFCQLKADTCTEGLVHN